MTLEARHRRVFARAPWRRLGSFLPGAFDPIDDEAFDGAKEDWRLRTRGFRAYAEAENQSGRIVAVVGLRFEARIIASPAVRAVLLGSELSARAAPLLATDRGVISFGICGGLAPKLRPGDCIVASSIYDGKRHWPTDKVWTKRLAELIPNTIIAPMLGVDAPVFDVAEKRRLFMQHGAVAVDMESHRAARLASVHRLPFVSVRAVADDAHCKVVMSAMAGRRADGSVSAAGVLGALGARPKEIIPLIRLAARANSARSALMRLRPLLADGLRGP